MVQAIQVLRFHLLEIEKVSTSCKHEPKCVCAISVLRNPPSKPFFFFKFFITRFQCLATIVYNVDNYSGTKLFRKEFAISILLMKAPARPLKVNHSNWWKAPLIWIALVKPQHSTRKIKLNFKFCQYQSNHEYFNLKIHRLTQLSKAPTILYHITY